MEHLEAFNAQLTTQADLPEIGSTVKVEGWHQRGWVHRLALSLQAAWPYVTFDIRNHGAGGVTSRQVASIVETDRATNGLDYDLVFLGCGINDVWRRFQNRITEAVGIDEYTAHMEPVIGDLREDAYVDRLCDLARDATVLYCAQVGGRTAADADPAAALRVNAIVPGRLATVAGRMVHLSSDYVFGTPGPGGELDPPRPADAYGESKAAGERAVLRAGRSATVVRTSGVFDTNNGPWGPFAALQVVEASDSRFTSPTNLPDLVGQLLHPQTGRRSGARGRPARPECLRVRPDRLSALGFRCSRHR